jgi:hypothetical protein
VFLVVVLLWFVVSVFVRFSVNKLDILFFLINILGQSFLPPFQKKKNIYICTRLNLIILAWDDLSDRHLRA